MQKKQVDRFFNTLSEELDVVITVILTGAAAGNLLGGVRPSLDIDFAIKLNKNSSALWDQVDQAIHKTIKKTGIDAQYSEDIGRWGMISLLDYEKQATYYKQYGSLRVLLMHPAYWSIGKMTRYLDSDIRDMITVFKKQKISPESLLSLWAKALQKSPRSGTQSLFKQHVDHFLLSTSVEIWGKKISPSHLQAVFRHKLQRYRGVSF